MRAPSSRLADFIPGRVPGPSSVTRRCLTRVLVIAGTVLVSVTAPARVDAQWAVFDGSNLTRHVMNYRQLLQQVAMQRDQLRYQLDNMRKLLRPDWRAISSTLTSIDELTRRGQALSYSLAAITAEFDRTFPGASLTPVLTATMAGDIRRQNERVLATIRATLEAANVTARQFPVSTTKLDAMKRQIGTITGMQQAGELNGTIGIHAAEELTLLRQQLAAASNAQSVFMAHQMNRDLQAAAAAARFREQAIAAPIRRKDMRVRAVGFSP